VRNNVILGADAIDERTARGSGVELLNCPHVLVEGNILAHKPDPINKQAALQFDPKKKDADYRPAFGEFRRNIVYDWSGAAFSTNYLMDGMSLRENCFQQGSWLLMDLTALRPEFTFADNRYWSTRGEPFQVNQKRMTFDQWRTATSDTSTMTQVKFVDPARDIASYAASIGLTDASLDGFMAAASEQCAGHWNPKLTAVAANAYIREGFTEVGAASMTKPSTP
jgi:hypothetical protein